MTLVSAVVGYEFDIKALKVDTSYTVDDRRGHKFDINVCAPAKGSPCEGNSGRTNCLV